MHRKCMAAAALACLLAMPAAADFSYEQSSKITGGMMAGMMKVAGVFSKTAREPIRTAVLVKGDRMANVSAKNIQVIDLARETITDIDLDRKSYSVITFADMRRAMEEMSRKMAEQQKNNPNASGDVTFSAKVDETGETKVINGLTARQVILTLAVEGRDQKTGDTGAMNIVTDMFIAPRVPGYEEVTRFYTRMAEKMAFSPMGGLGPMMRPEMMRGLGQVYKEMAKLDGVPVVQVIRMGGAATGTVPEGAEQSQQPAQPAPSAGQAAESAAASTAASAATSRMGRLGGAVGGLGGLGGLGRRKKQQQEEQAQQAPPPQQQAAPQPGERAQMAGVLMELTTELTGFSAGPVDASKFEVPAGFKQVQNPLEKELKK